MLSGGLFLLFKATVELNERLEGKDSDNPVQRKGASSGGGRSDCGTGCHFLPRFGDHRRRHGRPSGGDDGGSGYCHEFDAARQQSADAVCQQPPDYRYSLSEFPADDWFQPDCRRVWVPHPEGYLYAAIGFSVIIESLNQLALFNRRRFSPPISRYASARPKR